MKAFISENTTIIIIIANGKAAIIEAVCRAVNPPCHNKTAAVPDCTTPQTTFTLISGFRLPFVVCIPKTNVAESADVMKNVLINRISKTDIIVDIGKFSNTVNNAASDFIHHLIDIYSII